MQRADGSGLRAKSTGYGTKSKEYRAKGI